MGELTYAHCRIVGVPPEKLWTTFPDPQVRRMEVDWVERFHRQVWYTRMIRRRGQAQDRGRATISSEVTDSIPDIPAAYSMAPPAYTGLRPLLLSPDKDKSVVFSSRHPNQDPLTPTPPGRGRIYAGAHGPAHTPRTFSSRSETTRLVDDIPGAFPFPRRVPPLASRTISSSSYADNATRTPSMTYASRSVTPSSYPIQALDTLTGGGPPPSLFSEEGRARWDRFGLGKVRERVAGESGIGEAEE